MTSKGAMLLRDKDAHPLALHLILLEQFTDSCVQWEAETLWFEIQRELGSVAGPNKPKIQAVRTILTATATLRDYGTFQHVCAALMGLEPDFSQIILPSAESMAFCVSIINRLYSEPPVLGADVQKFIAAVLAEAGFVVAPAPLGAADDELALVAPAADRAAFFAAVRLGYPPQGSRTEIQFEKHSAVSAFLREMDGRLAKQLN